jgi:tRNA threonylcarbamoyladenosine biosynthesis protein TsaB
MKRLILIETSTALCSAALAEDGVITSYRESSAPKAHASLTAVFIQEMLEEKGLTIADCDAVCVSKGPGSYTGLRVGVSTAKGLCFGSGKPLIAISTLDILVAQAQIPDNLKYIVPMVDARRMEVYAAVYEIAGQAGNDVRQVTETAPAIIDENSYSDILEKGKVLFIGDGAGKCADVIKHPNATFVQCWPKASAMLEPAMKAYKEKRFEDVAYFEPFYLKEFVATVSKKKMW